MNYLPYWGSTEIRVKIGHSLTFYFQIQYIELINIVSSIFIKEFVYYGYTLIIR